MIRTSVSLTAPRFSSATPSIPTIALWDESRTALAHRQVMSAAHLIAAKLWSWNGSGWAIAVDATCDAGAQITIETVDGATKAPLDLMRDAIRELAAVAGLRMEPAYRGDPAADGAAAVRRDDARRARRTLTAHR